MRELKQNYYSSLCTEMYEILHEQAQPDELNFYLSYAEKGKKILEPLCGSGRFLVPFLERGFDISGMDLSEEMLDKLRKKAPGAIRSFPNYPIILRISSLSASGRSRRR